MSVETWPACPDCETDVFVHKQAGWHDGRLVCEFCGTGWGGEQ